MSWMLSWFSSVYESQTRDNKITSVHLSSLIILNFPNKMILNLKYYKCGQPEIKMTNLILSSRCMQYKWYLYIYKLQFYSTFYIHFVLESYKKIWMVVATNTISAVTRKKRNRNLKDKHIVKTSGDLQKRGS